MAKGVLIVHSEVAEGGDEAEFNRWYNEVHAPEIIERGAAVSFQRYAATDVPLSEGIPRPGSYVCIYQIEAGTLDDVKAIEQRLRDTKHLGRGVSDEMDRSSVRAGFYLPIEGGASA